MSSGQQIAEAVKEVAVATDKSADAGAMGIKGLLWNNIGNIAAMAIIAGAFMYLQREQVVQAREDRVMFRESVKAITDAADRRYEKSEVTHGKALEKMGATIDKTVSAMRDSADAAKASSVEMKEVARELKDTVRIIGKMGGSKGPGG